MWEPARRDRRSHHAELGSAAVDVAGATTISHPRPGHATRRVSGLFRVGWILNPTGDLVWFVALPFVALGIAFGFQHWLPYVAVASINLWITIPHHYATWVRTYGMPDEWERFKDRLIIGPIIIFATAAVGYVWAPITLLLLVTAWDHQHSIMQQHGFGRVYDFKAGTGTTTTGRFDLALHWILYSNMVINAPMFRHLWIRELYKMRIPLSAELVDVLTAASWIVMTGFLLCYAWHVAGTLRRGTPLNPVKYVYIFSSYFLWYVAAWHTNSVLLYAVAHRIMHGVQYMVMVNAFLGRKAAHQETRRGFWSWVSGDGRLKWFLLCGGAYAVLFQLLIQRPLDEFGFGVVNFAPYQAIPAFNLPALDAGSSYELFAYTMVASYGLLHYYVDSFIWKVRDKNVQGGL